MDRRENLWVVLFLVVGAAGLGLFMEYYDEAFRRPRWTSG